MKIISITENEAQAVAAAQEFLRIGNVIAFPTDTSYGLTCDIENSAAIETLFAIKERKPDKPIHVLVDSVEMAQRFVVWNVHAERLAQQFWPGPLTLVLPLKKNVPVGLETLSAQTGFLGVRIPQQPFVQQLVMKWGKPLPAPSANPSSHLSGGVDSYTPEEIVRQFAPQQFKPDAILSMGALPHVAPSTLVKIENNTFAVLRQGPIILPQEMYTAL